MMIWRPPQRGGAAGYGAARVGGGAVAVRASSTATAPTGRTAADGASRGVCSSSLRRARARALLDGACLPRGRSRGLGAFVRTGWLAGGLRVTTRAGGGSGDAPLASQGPSARARSLSVCAVRFRELMWVFDGRLERSMCENEGERRACGSGQPRKGVGGDRARRSRRRDESEPSCSRAHAAAMPIRLSLARTASTHSAIASRPKRQARAHTNTQFFAPAPPSPVSNLLLARPSTTPPQRFGHHQQRAGMINRTAHLPQAGGARPQVVSTRARGTRPVAQVLWSTMNEPFCLFDRSLRARGHPPPCPFAFTTNRDSTIHTPLTHSPALKPASTNRRRAPAAACRAAPLRPPPLARATRPAMPRTSPPTWRSRPPLPSSTKAC